MADITLSKPTICNETLDVIGNLSTENEFRVDIGATGSPEFRVLGNSVDFYEKFIITHQTAVGAVEQIFLRNPDTDGETGTKNVLTVTTDGIDVIGDISYTGSIGPSSDQRLKKISKS